MKRRLFSTGVAVSLVLCAGVAVLWIKSYAGSYVYSHLRGWGAHVGAEHGWFTLHVGSVGYLTSSTRGALTPTSGAGWGQGFLVVDTIDSRRFGLGIGYQRQMMSVEMHGVVALTVALAIPAVGAYRFQYRRQRRAKTACPACGYDLRGTPSGGGSECPECGTAYVSGEERQAKA